MFNGKMKAVTFSYDDCTVQDVRLVNLFNKYNLKCTFNINSELLGRKGNLVLEGKTVNWSKVDKSDVKRIYQGHEVAAHTLTHPFLPNIEDEREVLCQVEEDNLNEAIRTSLEALKIVLFFVASFCHTSYYQKLPPRKDTHFQGLEVQ